MTNRDTTSTNAGCFFAILILIVELVSYPIYGFVLSSMWKWFVSPVFFVPNIDWVQVVGIFFLFSTIKSLFLPISNEENAITSKLNDGTITIYQIFARRIGERVFSPLFLLFCAWLWRMYS